MTDLPSRLTTALADRYRIERKLGEGGMASVYLAEDVKHQRKVAVKVLRPELAAVIGAERFLSEITTTAKLQHPHILALFDSGEADGFLYYVMPYVEGETLRDRLDREKQLGVDEAVRIAHDVADALDYAHRNGVIHRDIKPANILLHDGRPVVADFGIALAISAAGGGRMTETGLSLGTPHYMSPEQASADRDLSARSDVYSLGCVLYEMIAGQPPHTGPSAQSILVRILTESPRPLTDMRHTVPAHVAATVMKSIEKLPADRFESAKAFREALADTSFTYAPTAPTRSVLPAAAPARPATGRGIPVWATALAGAVLLATGYGLSRLTQREAPLAPSAMFAIMGDSTFRLTSPCCGRSVAVSPNGDRVVFQGILGSDQGGTVQLFQRPLDQRQARPIPNTEDARHPFFSPDGEWVAYVAGNSLRKVRLDGGTPLTVATGIGPSAGGAWAPDNSIVYATRSDPRIFRVTDGGQPVPITVVDSAGGELEHAWPHVMPDGRNILFWASVRREDGTTADMMAVGPLEGGPHRLLVAGADPRYVEPGFLVFSDAAGSIMAQPFDAGRLEVSGERFRVAENSTWRGDGSSEFDISRNGTLAYLESPNFQAGVRELVLVDLSGNVETLAAVSMARAPRFSPDGRYVAYEVESMSEATKDDIWVWDRIRSVPTRVTFEDDNSLPEWSPDGTRLFYDTPEAILSRAADGSGESEFVQPAAGVTPPYITPDGAWLLWTQPGNGALDVWIRPLDGTAEAKPLLQSPFAELSPTVSPDGRWIAYTSNASGQPEIYVEPFPTLGSRFKVTTGGAWEPLWAPDGSRLYFRTSATNGFGVSAVDVRGGERFDVGPPTELFQVDNLRSVGTATNYDLSPDGTHFVFVRGSGAGSAREAAQVVITNALNQGLFRP